MDKQLLIVDLEATCWPRAQHKPEEMETIEIGAILLAPGDLGETLEYQSFVQPVRHPQLSDFCTNLTKISQAEVAAALPFPSALAHWLGWLGDPQLVRFASWGECDVFQLQRDCNYHGVHYPFAEDALNLKREIGRRLNCGPSGLQRAIATAGLPPAGTAHRALDDARNALRLWRHVMQLGEHNL